MYHYNGLHTLIQGPLSNGDPFMCRLIPTLSMPLLAKFKHFEKPRSISWDTLKYTVHRSLPFSADFFQTQYCDYTGVCTIDHFFITSVLSIILLWRSERSNGFSALRLPCSYFDLGIWAIESIIGLVDLPYTLAVHKAELGFLSCTQRKRVLSWTTREGLVWFF